jgi:type II secretory pathway component GspD/PulD (secretin)
MTTAYTPGNIKTGLDLTIIPHIQGDKIYLSLNAILSTLQGIKTIGGDNSANDEGKMKNLSQIQLPQTEDRVFNQRIMAHNHNVIVLSGFKVKQNATQDNKNFGISELGGNYGLSSNIELVVLIQPTIIKRAM